MSHNKCIYRRLHMLLNLICMHLAMEKITKTLIITLAFIMMNLYGVGQTTVTVMDEGNTVTGHDAVIYGWGSGTTRYSLFQHIYEQSLINESGDITHIQLKCGIAGTFTKVKIYMGETAKSSFSGTSDWVNSGLTLVYDGSLNVENGWYEIELDDEFEYTNTDNLIIVFHQYGGTTPNSGSARHRRGNAGANVTLRNYDDYDNYGNYPNWSSNGTRYSSLPDLKLTFAADDCIAPTLDAKYDGENSKTICAGDSYTLSVNSSGGLNCSGDWAYAWFTGDGEGSTYYNGTTWDNASDAADVWVTTYNSVEDVAPVSTTTYNVKVRCDDETTCISDAVSVTVTVNSIPAAPTGDAAQTFCEGATVADLSATGNDIKWYADAIGGEPKEPTEVLVDATDYYASQTVNGCESTDRLQVTATVTTLPTITETTPGSRCGEGIVELSATASAGDLRWYDAETEGLLLYTGTAFTTPPISETTSYWAEAYHNDCPSAIRTEVVATIKSEPNITSQPTNADICDEGQDAVFSVTATGTGTVTYQWQVNDGGWENISEEISSTLTIPATSTVDGMQYKCLINDDDNCGPIETDIVQINKAEEHCFVVYDLIIESNDSYTIPCGVSEVVLEAWGGGGAGGGAGYSCGDGGKGGGGGGGAYSRVSLNVNPGDELNITVGNGGTPNSGGGSDSYVEFDATTVLLAKGGSGGITGGTTTAGAGGSGGQASEGTGEVKYKGGSGAAGNQSSPAYGGAGGGSGGTNQDGGHASLHTRGYGGELDGGDGAEGKTTAGSGFSATQRGGGGGGSFSGGGATTGGNGAKGAVRVSFTVNQLYYRSIDDGDWEDDTNWQVSFNGNDWKTFEEWLDQDDLEFPDCAPSKYHAKHIRIKSEHKVTINADVEILSPLIIEPDAELEIQNGKTLKIIEHGTNTDLFVYGTLKNSGTFSFNGKGIVYDGGKYIHNRNGGLIPVLDWQQGSNCEITGATNSMPGGRNQEFWNFVWNCSSQSSILQFDSDMNIKGDFVVKNTNATALYILSSGDANHSLNVGENILLKNGRFRMTDINDNQPVINVGKDFVVDGGDFIAMTHSGALPVLNVGGSLLVESGDFLAYNATTAGNGFFQINFEEQNPTSQIKMPYGSDINRLHCKWDINIKSGKTLEFLSNIVMGSPRGGIKKHNVFSVESGATVDFRNYEIITSTNGFISEGEEPQFNIQAEASLITSHAEGIYLVGDLLGSVKTTGTRTYNTGANYKYNGSVTQVTGNGLVATNNLIIDNSDADGVTLSRNVTVNGSLFLENGILNSTDTELLTMSATSSVGSVSNSSYVDGPVRKVGNSAFTFPVGNGGYYAPIGISAPSDAADHFTAQYFNSNPNSLYSVSSLGVGIHHVSSSEYWILDRTNGNSNVKVTLSWDDRSGPVTDLETLIVARWDGDEWVDQGNNETTGDISPGNGTITSNLVNVFSPFTLGSTDKNNPLPINLLSFKAECNNRRVHLKWQTASEINNDYFILEKSYDAINFNKISRINGAGFSNNTLEYTYVDEDIQVKLDNYYRLTQVDYDGTSETFNIIYVNCKVDNDNNASIIVYPNPSNNYVNIIFNNFESDFASIELYNENGQLILKEEIKEICSILQYSLDINHFKPAVYMLRIVSEKHLFNKKIVKP